MNDDLLFRLVTVALLALALGIAGYYRRRADRQGGALETNQGRRLLIGLRLLALVAFFPLILYLLNPAWAAWARVGLPDWLRWLGAVMALAVAPLLVWMFHAIGANISPTQATRTGHRLVTAGPYRWIRHPLYSLGGAYFYAIALVSGVWWTAALLTVALAILVWRTDQEEANLVARFGDEYRAYMARTGRFLPRWGLR